MSLDVQSLRDRKLFSWSLVYIAAAWLVMQVVEVVASRWDVPVALQRGIDVALIVGFFVALVVAWYHGEQGRQRVSGMEILLLALLLGIGGGIVGMVGSAARVEHVQPPVSAAEPGVPSAADIVPLRKVLVDNPAVAVLPLENFGAAEDAPFVDGLHDDVLSALQKIGGLTVISRTSVQRYRDDPKPIPVIARELAVDALAEGSVSRAGGRIRANIQLIDGESDAHLWAEQYDHELTAENIFAIRSEIAHSVARALKAELTPQEEAQLATVPTTSLTAHDWLQIARGRPDASPERIDAIRRALEADSLSSAAWALLAANRALQIQWHGSSPDVADSAFAAADRALELDPLSSLAYRAKGMAAGAQGQITRALDYTRRAVELDPGSASAWNNLGVHYWATGQWVDAHDAYLRRLRLQPANAFIRANIGDLYARLGLHERAVANLEGALEIAPKSRGAHQYLSLAYALQGDLDIAREYAEQLLTLHSTAPLHLWAARVASFQRDTEGVLAHAQAAHELAPAHELGLEGPSLPRILGYALLEAGDTAAGHRYLDRAAALMRERLERGADDPRTRREFAAIEAVRGNTDHALRWLTEAYEAGYRDHRLIELDPVFDDLRGLADYEEIMERMREDVADMRRRVIEIDAELEQARRERQATPSS